MNRPYLLGAALMVFLVGCMSVSDVSALDRDTYSVTASTQAGPPHLAEFQTQASSKARAFCNQNGKDVIAASYSIVGGRGYMLNFHCVAR